MSLILVSPLSAVPGTMRAYNPSHLISLLSPEFMIETPEGFPPSRHLRVNAHDIAAPEPGKTHICAHHISALLEFARSWDAKRPMLVHCWAGVSRSQATAFSILCDRSLPGDEQRSAREIRARAPHAHPNRLIVRLADDMLDRQGNMMKAVEDMGPGSVVEEGPTVEYPLADFGL